MKFRRPALYVVASNFPFDKGKYYGIQFTFKSIRVVWIGTELTPIMFRIHQVIQIVIPG